MSSKAIALTMGNGYQTSVKTAMSQRHGTWGKYLLYLVGLFAFFTFVWYVAKLETEVTSMKSLLVEHTRQIDELRNLCQGGHGTTDTITDNQNLDDWTTIDEDIDKDEDTLDGEETSVDMEAGLDTTDIDVDGKPLTFDAFDIEDDPDNNGDNNVPANQLLNRLKRNVVAQEDEVTSQPGGGSQTPTERECTRACNKGRVLPEGCEPCPEKNTKKQNKPEGTGEKQEHHRHRGVSAAHFVGYSDTVASVDNKNPQMAPVGGLIPYWRYASWMDESQRAMFTLNHLGNVTVHKTGIYFVYSQVMYYDGDHPFVGHSVYVNNERFLTCTECVTDRILKYNTCYIGGVTRIEANATIGIKVGYAQRTINLSPDATYFGLVGLGF